MHSALLDRQTRRLYYRSEMGDLDETSDSDIDWGNCIGIPHKSDLGLGRDLVFGFVAGRLPEELDTVVQMFHRPGAYERFKDLLHSKGLLQTWYDFEAQEQERALREWCALEGIEISG